MFLAMILVLTLLPSLILHVQPFEKKLNVWSIFEYFR
jgi:hypothetical protein